MRSHCHVHSVIARPLGRSNLMAVASSMRLLRRFTPRKDKGQAVASSMRLLRRFTPRKDKGQAVASSMRLLRFARNDKGQVVVEWLLLMAMAFITAYIMIANGPLPRFTGQLLNDIRTRLGNVVRNAEMETSGVEPGTPGHPSDPRRMKPLHL